MRDRLGCTGTIVFDARAYARKRGLCECEDCLTKVREHVYEYAGRLLPAIWVTTDLDDGATTCECSSCQGELRRLEGTIDWRRVAGTCPCDECDDKWHTVDYQHVVVEDVHYDAWNAGLCLCDSCIKQYMAQYEAAVDEILPQARVVFGRYERDQGRSCDCERCEHVWQAAHDACRWEDISRACECEECREEREESRQ